MPKKKKYTCYYCQDNATSKEHLPPKVLFKEFMCDSLTVPSCALHNTDKSGNDQSIFHGFLMSLSNGMAQYSLNQKTKDVISKTQPNFKYSKKTITSVEMLPGIQKFAYSTADIPNWMRQLTAGLVYDALQHCDTSIRWDKATVLSLHYFEGPISTHLNEWSDQVEKKLPIIKSLESKQWQNGWSATPHAYPTDIYFFEFCITPNTTWFKHIFYKSYEFYVAFSNTPKTSLALTQKASTQHKVLSS